MNSAGNDLLADALLQAKEPGETAAPAKLISLAAALAQPLQALQDLHDAHGLFAAFDGDFGFIRLSFRHQPKGPNAPTPPDNRARYGSLLRWLIEELRNWRRADDPDFRKLVAIMIAARVCDFGNELWNLLPDDIGENLDLIAYLKSVVASFDVAFNAVGGRAPPIWEGELVEAFQRADAEGNWAAIVDIWRRIPPMFANALQAVTVRILDRYDRAGLAQSLAQVRKTVVAMQVVAILDSERRLQLGLASENPYVQFAATYRSLVDERGSLRQLGENDGALLTRLFLKVSSDTPRWAAWMKAFVGYAALQRPLGRALAEAPDAALEGYVNSVRLYPKQVKPGDAGRQSAAECLRAFSADAAPERRAAMWRLARARWLDWDINKADPNQHLMAITWSDSDYAIVAYALECMDEASRNQEMQSIRDQITNS